MLQHNTRCHATTRLKHPTLTGHTPHTPAGAVEGVARVITNLADQASSVKAGEILVAHYTSPAWSPLFSLIAAIVLESGGMLSHGAVVARECGIPAVSQIKSASQDINTGDVIRVNGVSGKVEILKRVE